MSDGERLPPGRDKPCASQRGQGGDPGTSRLRRVWQRRQRRRTAKKARIAAMSRRRRVLRRIGVVGTWFLGVVAAFMVATIVLFYTLTDVPRPETLPLPQVATILYSDGSVLARIGPVDRTIVSIDQVPDQVRWAVLAAEDRSFYTEPGVSITGTIRAALSDLTGGNTQGGSGITQQYVKNAYLSDAQTLTRKLKELMIAIKLARQYSKDQILEFYLNTVYFGRGTYGIEAAAKAYFGVDVQKLTTAQGAVLAASLRAPSYYDPAQHSSAALARWHYVIDGMVATGHLGSAQASTLTYPRVRKPRGTGLGAVGWTSFIVRRVLAELDARGIPEKEVYAKGLTIRTTINKKAQSAALSAIHTTFANLTKQQRSLKNALAALDPATGAVLAYYGGSGPARKNYAGRVDYNDYAGQRARPPGSSFKPYTLATVLTQTLDHTSGKPQLALNSYVDGSYCVTIEGTRICNDPGDQSLSSSSVTIANAMKYSLNTTFDQLASEAGPDNVAATAHEMGISQTDSDGNPTLVQPDGHTNFGIGIGDYPVSPLDQAVGFSTLANGGARNDAYFVQKATSSDGEVVFEHNATPHQAIDPKVANDVTLSLEPIASYSGDGLAGGRVSAAKTGTEGIQGDPQNNNSDAWMVGYTPQVSAAAWVGSGDSTHAIYSSSGGQEYGSDMPGRTWRLFMDTYLAGKPDLPMASTQMIMAGANAGAPIGVSSSAPPPVAGPPSSTTPPPTHSTTPESSSSSPAPTPTRTSSTPTPSSSTPTPTQTTPTPTPTSSTPSPTCTPGVVSPRCPSPTG